jgi:hypothetical protein
MMPALSRSAMVVLVTVVCSLSLAAQGEKFEQKIAFGVDKALTVNGTAGPVKVATLKITDLGRGYSKGGLSLRSLTPPSELSTTLRFALDVNNPTKEEWQVTFTLELLDKDGKVIDRLTKKENYDNESKVLTLEHPVLEYVMPLVTDVKISLQGKKE